MAHRNTQFQKIYFYIKAHNGEDGARHKAELRVLFFQPLWRRD